MHRHPRTYGSQRRRSTLIVAVVVLASVALMAARLRQDTGSESVVSVHQILDRSESEQQSTPRRQEIAEVTILGADVSGADAARCQARGGVLVVKLADYTETAMPRASCVDPKHLEPLPGLSWVTLAP